MRKKSPRLVVTFHTTAEAMATEKLCRALGLAGRLIPVPRQLSSDCGLAWSAPAELAEAVEAALAERGIETAGLHRLELA
jgi:hypothetical protein